MDFCQKFGISIIAGQAIFLMGGGTKVFPMGVHNLFGGPPPNKGHDGGWSIPEKIFRFTSRKKHPLQTGFYGRKWTIFGARMALYYC